MKYSWKFIKDNIHNHENTFVFERLPSVKLAHSNNSQLIKSDYVLSGDYIKIKYMNWRPFKNADGKIFAVRKKESVDSIIIKNTFPYNLRKGIQHYNLFSVESLSVTEVNSQLYEFVGGKNIWFVNHPSIQSIPDLWHCHYFFITNDDSDLPDIVPTIALNHPV
jgi:hypothetical protein